MSTDFAALWDEAVKKYKSETNEDLTAHLFSPNISAEAILDEVQKREDDFISFREKREGLRGKIAPLCFTLQSWAETVGHFVKLTFPPGEGICEALVILLKAANGVSKKYNAIADMLEDFNGLLSRVQLFTEDQLSDLMRRMIVESLAHVLVVLGLATKAIKEGRGRAFLFKLIGKDGKVQSALRKMDNLSNRENHTVAAVGLSTTNKVLARLEEGMQKNQDENEVLKNMIAIIASEANDISDMSQESRAILEDIRRCVSGTSDFIRDQKYHDIIRWIDAPGVSSNHEDACEKRTPGTGSWLMKDDRYLRWKSGEDARPLWLNGGPGCGKSVLVSTVIEDIKFTQMTEASTLLAYFYFDFRDLDKQKCRNLVASVVDQLSFSSPEARTVIEAQYANLHMSKRHLSWRDLVAILESLCNVTRQTYIVVDALDECTEWDELSHFLKMVLNFESASIRLLCSSRKEVRIQDILTATSTQINLESSIVNSDISTYVESSLRNDKRFAKWKDREKSEIKTALKSRANGMFRWVYCQLETLSCSIKPKALRKALQTLPASLYETYDRILLQIDFEHGEDVLHILQWLLYAYRPMTLEKIAEIVAIDFDDDPPKFIPEDRLPDLRDVAKICGNLVTFKTWGFLELAHFSVKEYLITSLSSLSNRSDLKASEMTRLARYQINENLAHTFIARSCLVYLIQFSEPIDSKTRDLFPLARYAAEYWVHYSHRGDLSSLNDLILSLFDREDQQFHNWIRLYDFDAKYSWQIEDVNKEAETIPTRLYYAALLGLKDIAEELLIRREDANVQSGRHGSPLQIASLYGHEAMIQLLLAYNADVNMGGGYFGSALQAAAYGGHEEVVKLFLENGADVNVAGGEYGSALQAAANHGNQAMVKQLLENGADINLGGGVSGSALQAAAGRGHEEVAKFLLENGADIKMGGGKGSALQDAAFGGHEAVVKLLLANGADVNHYMFGGIGGPALQEAACNGHEAVVKLLIESGADVNLDGGLYGSALQAAARDGHEAVVKLLLENGADVNMDSENYFGSALQAAASKGHEAVVNLLLMNGADINIGGGAYRSALQAAAYDGHEAVIRLLLENGADVDMGGGHYGSALQAAASSGHEASVKLLLENGADVSKGYGYYGSALQAAAGGGHEAVVKLLLENGAEVNTSGGYYGSALQAAAYKGHKAVAKLLLDNGARRCGRQNA